MQKKFSLILINFALLFGAIAATSTKVSAEEEAPAYTPVAGKLGTMNIDDSHLNDAEVNAYYDGSRYDEDEERQKADVNGLRGDALLAALYDNIKNHEEYNYATAGQVYKITDRNWDLSPLEGNDLNGYVFTHDTGEKDDNPYLVKLYADYNDDENTADKYRNEVGEKVTFDKEHIWAQSLGDYGRGMGAGSDLHALWPSDRAGNQGAHSNFNFSEPTIDRKSYRNDKGTISGYNGKIDGYDHKVFEPLDEFKGDVARAMFYMPARYYEWVDDERPKLSLINGSPSPVVAAPGSPGLAGDLEMLLQWHEEDPVSEFEIRRNNLLYNNFQKNRNPFIDHPEWARIAYDTNYSGPAAATTSQTSSVGALSDPFRVLDITHLELNTDNVKKTYFKEDAFSLAGLSVRAHYSDGSSKLIRNYGSDIKTGDILVNEGLNTVTIDYTHIRYVDEQTSVEKEVTKTFDVNVKSITLRDALMISEVYGGGGNSGAPINSDFVELYNASDEPINLNGKSVQYSAATSNNYQVARLEGIIEPKSYYLVQFASGASGVELPLAEASAKTNFAIANVKVALLNSAVKFDDTAKENLDDNADLIDFLGGGTANKALGTKKTGGTNEKSYQRKFVGGEIVNTRSNSEDFITDSPTPMNGALSVAEKILINNIPTVEAQPGEVYEDVLEAANKDQCLTRYEPAKEMVLKLSENVYEETEEGYELAKVGQLTYFKEGNYGIMPDGRMRYEAWAIAIGDSHPYELINQENTEQPTSVIINTTEGYIYVVIMAFFVFGGYFIFTRKKEHN